VSVLLRLISEDYSLSCAESHRVEALSEFRFELWTMGEKLDDRVIKEFSHPDAGLNLFNAYVCLRMTSLQNGT